MFRFLTRRLLQALLVMFMVVTFVFVVLRMIGDPTKLLISPESSWEDLERTKRLLGLDRPVYAQYLDYIGGILRGDLGVSLYSSQPVWDIIRAHLPATLLLGATSLILSVPLAMFSGIVAAVKRNSVLDNVVTTITIAGRSLPAFWYGLILIIVFSARLKWLPGAGYGTFEHLILPAVTLSAGMAASTARLTRSSMLEVIRQDYMTTARSKGLTERRVILHHGLRNALLTIVTMIGMQVGRMISGSVVIESVFAWPGVGRTMVQAIFSYDFPLVQACVLVMATVFAVVNILTDICYVLIDPRIRLDS